MPPCCAFSPLVLGSLEPNEMQPEPDEGDGRVRVIALLVNALSEAEDFTAAEQRNEERPEFQRRLSQEAYNSLCFDFPVVSTCALAALVSAIRSSSLDDGKPIFPVTMKFVSGLRYLCSTELGKQSSLVGRDASSAVLNAEQTELEVRCYHLLTLCGLVFLSAPALRLAKAHTDDGASLRDYFGVFGPSSSDQSNADYSEDFHMDASPNGTSAVIDEQDIPTEQSMNTDLIEEMADELDNDDFEWEPLETALESGPLGSRDEPVFEEARWLVLMLKVSYITSFASLEIIHSSVWEELKLTDQLLEALNGLRILEEGIQDVDVMVVARLYSVLLADRLVGASLSMSNGSEVTQVVSSLFSVAKANKAATPQYVSRNIVGGTSMRVWDFLVLSTVATLCHKCGTCFTGQPSWRVRSRMKDSGQLNVHSSPIYTRSLWQVIRSQLSFLEAQLSLLLKGSVAYMRLDSVLQILCFLVIHAPGNADLYSMLLEGGLFRNSLQLFTEVGRDPQMECLRRFVLISMASSPQLTRFGAQVPAFIVAISDPGFCKEGSRTSAYAIVFSMLLHTTESCQSAASRWPDESLGTSRVSAAEKMAAVALKKNTKAVEVNAFSDYPNYLLSDLAWVHWLLELFEEAAAATRGSVFKLWQRGGLLDGTIAQCHLRLATVFVQLNLHSSNTSQVCIGTQAIGVEESSSSTPDVYVHHEVLEEGKEQPQSSNKELKPVQEKLKELLPKLLLQLKYLSTLAKGEQGGKSD